MNLSTSSYKRDEKQRKERDEALALQFDGTITLVAIVRCATHCGKFLTLYPGFNEEISRKSAAGVFEKYGWRCSPTHGWVCSTCQSTPPRTQKVASL
jgi:hypothetical protein